MKLTHLWPCCGVFEDSLYCPSCGASLFDEPVKERKKGKKAKKGYETKP